MRFATSPIVTSALTGIRSHKKQTLIAAAIAICVAAPFAVSAYRNWRTNAEIARLTETNVIIEQVLAEQVAKMTPEQLRQFLATSYKSLMDKANPSLNDIAVSVDG